MFAPPLIRDWARRLIASEVYADPPSAATELATLRVYEKLRRRLCAPVGVDGFQALAARALSLAKSQSPRLDAVQVTANGALRGLGEVVSQRDTDEDGEVGILLIAQLLGLFLNLLGEAATVRLIDGLPLHVEVKAKLNTPGMSNPAMGASHFGPFEEILSEADQLRKVGKRLQALANKHAGVGELMSVAGNILNIATVLDVFTLMRSEVGGAQDNALSPPNNGYMN